MVFSKSLINSTNDGKGDEVKQRFVLFAIVAMFFICHALRITLNIAEMVDSDFKQEQWKKGCPGIGFWGMIALPISGLMLQINSSTDFFIYCIYDNLFKEVLYSHFPTPRRRRTDLNNIEIEAKQDEIEMKHKNSENI